MRVKVVANCGDETATVSVCNGKVQIDVGDVELRLDMESACSLCHMLMELCGIAAPTLPVAAGGVE